VQRGVRDARLAMKSRLRTGPLTTEKLRQGHAIEV
jgi:hypothetical protein